VLRPTQQPQIVAQHEERIERLRPGFSQVEHGSGERGRYTAIAVHRSGPGRNVESDDVVPAIVQGDARPTRTGADVEHATVGQFEGRVQIGGEVPRCILCREEAVRSLYQFVRDSGGPPACWQTRRMSPKASPIASCSSWTRAFSIARRSPPVPTTASEFGRHERHASNGRPVAGFSTRLPLRSGRGHSFRNAICPCSQGRRCGAGAGASAARHYGRGPLGPAPPRHCPSALSHRAVASTRSRA
jgi:hypothetical protein